MKRGFFKCVAGKRTSGKKYVFIAPPPVKVEVKKAKRENPKHTKLPNELKNRGKQKTSKKVKFGKLGRVGHPTSPNKKNLRPTQKQGVRNVL